MRSVPSRKESLRAQFQSNANFADSTSIVEQTASLLSLARDSAFRCCIIHRASVVETPRRGLADLCELLSQKSFSHGTIREFATAAPAHLAQEVGESDRSSIGLLSHIGQIVS